MPDEQKFNIGRLYNYRMSRSRPSGTNYLQSQTTGWSKKVSYSTFYARKQLLLSARLSHRSPVRLSVCLSHRLLERL